VRARTVYRARISSVLLQDRAETIAVENSRYIGCKGEPREWGEGGNVRRQI